MASCMRCSMPIYTNEIPYDGNRGVHEMSGNSDRGSQPGRQYGHGHIQSMPLHRKAHMHANSRKESTDPSYRVIYDSESDIEIVKCFCPGCIVDLHDEMQNGIPFLYQKQNRIAALQDFAEHKATQIGPLILQALGNDAQRRKVHAHLNMPTFVGFRMLDRMGLPQEGDVVFSSTATANSSHDDAVTSALDILGYTDAEKKITFHRSSTVTDDGSTAFGHRRPKNNAVYFNPRAHIDEFADGVARPLAEQFFSMTLRHNNGQAGNDGKPMGVFPTYDKMYHYGCISQSKSTDTFGMPVTNWGIHEQWNILMGSAMMHHVALTLKAGGNALVKVRIMKRAETLGLIALLSSLFERLEIVDVPDQSCTYAGALFFGMTSDAAKRQNVADTIWNSMDQSPANIFCNDVMQGDATVKQNLELCDKHRRSMMDCRASVDTLFMDCVQHLVEQIKHKKDPHTFPMKDELKRHHGPKMGEYFWKRWVEVNKNLLNKMPEEADNFLWVMQRRWSIPWHGK